MSKRKPLKGDPQKELRESLSLKIGQWAFDELGYSENASRPVDPSSCKVFQNLCKGINGKIWESVISNVKRVKSSGSNSIDPSISTALKKLSALNDQSKSLDLELMQERSHAKELQITAATLQEKLDKDLNHVSHLKRSTVILETNSNQTKLKVLHFTQIHNRLMESFEYFTKTKEEEEEEEFSSITCTSRKIQKQKISVENDIMEIEKSIYSLCCKYSVGKSTAEDESFHKKLVTALIVYFMKNNSLKTIMKCLSSRAIKATNKATHLMNALNIEEEMEGLGYSYIARASAGDSDDQIVQIEDQCMEDHLANLRSKHIKINSEYELVRSKIQTLFVRRKTLDEKIEQSIQDSHKRQMVINLLNTEISARNIQSKINSLKKEISKERNETTETNPNLIEKLEIIEDIEQQIQHKHASILSTMVANQEIKTAIVSCFQILQDARSSFTQMNLCNLLTSVEIWKEKKALGIQLFCCLEMKDLYTLHIKDKPIACSELNLFLIEQNPFLCQIKDSFYISRAQSFDYLLKRVIQQKKDYDTNGNFCTEQLDLINEMKNFQASQRERVEEFQLCLKEFNDELSKRVPVIKESLNDIPCIQAKYQDAMEQINIWWTLPAFHVRI